MALLNIVANSPDPDAALTGLDQPIRFLGASMVLGLIAIAIRQVGMALDLGWDQVSAYSRALPKGREATIVRPIVGLFGAVRVIADPLTNTFMLSAIIFLLIGGLQALDDHKAGKLRIQPAEIAAAK